MNNLTLNQKTRIFRNRHLLDILHLACNIENAEIAMEEMGEDEQSIYDRTDADYMELGKYAQHILDNLGLKYSDLVDSIMDCHDKEYTGYRAARLRMEKQIIYDMSEWGVC